MKKHVSIYIGIIVFQLLKHSDELDIKTSTLLGAQHFYWEGLPPVPPMVTALFWTSLSGVLVHYWTQMKQTIISQL